MRPTRERIAWLDMAKGYGIILVIIGHFDLEGITIPLYSFHMPLFFFLAGYTYSVKSPFSYFAFNKARKLIIPYFTLCVPIIFTHLILMAEFSLQGFLKESWLFVLQQRYTALWFLTTLIILHFAFYPIIRYCNQPARCFFAFAMSGLGLFLWRHHITPLPWNCDAAMVIAPFFYAGYCFQEQVSLKRFAGITHTSYYYPLLISLGLATIALSYLNYAMAGNMINISVSFFREEWLAYITASLGIVFILILSVKFTRPAISYIGRNSLVIFAWHQDIVIRPLIRVYTKLNIYITESDFTSFLLKSISIIIVLIIMIAINEIICHTRLKFIIGR